MHSIPLLQGSTSDNVLTQHAYPCLREQVCSHLEPPVVLLNIYEFENVNGYLRSHCHGTQKCPASACSHYPHASTNMCSILLKAWFPSTSKGIAPLEFWTSKPTVASTDANSLHHPTLQELHDKTTVLNDLVFNARKAFYVAVKDSGYTMCIINCDQMCAHSSLIL